MTATLIKQFQDVLGNLEQFSPEKLQALIQDTLKVFQDLQQRINSSNPEDREEALGAALELKNALETQAAALAQSVGMDPNQLEKFIENPSNFSKEEWEAMGSARQDLTDFQQHLTRSINHPIPSSTTPKKRVSKSEWIPG